ncbi:MAG: helix-turn-helix domain-containing protein [Propionibacteriaceae bacterium]|jgi:excisionase family DNA binding protein|nr:helix-turn-helix domain-containing protein [Propionibacteriaceae bacterium]
MATLVKTGSVSSNQVEKIEGFLKTDISPELREVLSTLIACIKAGTDLVEVGPSTELTPSQAAKVLNMSRTYLYRLMDRGDIQFHRVGRDRRLTGADIATYIGVNDAGNRELAERFAKQDQADKAAVIELAELM